MRETEEVTEEKKETPKTWEEQYMDIILKQTEKAERTSDQKVQRNSKHGIPPVDNLGTLGKCTKENA